MIWVGHLLLITGLLAAIVSDYNIRNALPCSTATVAAMRRIAIQYLNADYQ